MVWDRDNYYLLCFSDGHKDIVTYRLDKMDDVNVEETEREPHEEYEVFNSEDYKKQVFNMFAGETKRVTLQFTKCMLSDIYDRFGDDVKVRKVDDDTYLTDITVQVSKTLFTWVVGTQGNVQIKSPRKVADDFNDFVAKIKEVY